ncbi:MAG TPA: TetR family transcriptional regulator [Chloroflexota bacterium]
MARVKRRAYRSSRRQQQAQATRSAIVEAARGLFLTRGYSGTTIDAIAAAANVAPITVYAAFHGKRGILDRLIATSLVGDDADVPLLEREGPQAVLHDTNQARQVAGFAADIAAIMDRISPIFEVMRNAAPSEPEVAQLLEALLRERLQGMRVFVEALMRNGPLLAGVSIEAATETTWALSSPDLHRLVTTRLGWSAAQYAEWLAGMLSRALLRD